MKLSRLFCRKCHGTATNPIRASQAKALKRESQKQECQHATSPTTTPTHPSYPPSTTTPDYRSPSTDSPSLPPLPILPPTPNQQPLPPKYQLRLLLRLPLNRLGQPLIIPRQPPQRPVDHRPHSFNLRVVFRSDVALCEPGCVARAGAAGEGEGRRWWVRATIWKVRVWRLGGVGGGGVGAGERCYRHCGGGFCGRRLWFMWSGVFMRIAEAVSLLSSDLLCLSIGSEYVLRSLNW